MSEKVVPDGWEVKRLSQLSSFSGGSAFNEKYQGQITGDYPFIKVSDMNYPGNRKFINVSNNWIDSSIQKKARIKLFPKNSIVFAKVGAALLLNKRRILVRETAIDNNMMAAIPTKSDFLFLYYLLQSIDFSDFVQEGAVPSVNQGQMDEIRVISPPIYEQQKIASILTSVDEVIEKTQSQINKLQDLKKGTMNELLTCGIGHTEFKDSPVGRIPKGWEVQKFKDITLSITCGVAATPKYVDESEGIPFLSAQNVQSGAMNLKRFKYVGKDFHLQLTKNTKPELGDILYSRVGAGYGEAAIIEFEWECSIYVSLTLIKMGKQQSPEYCKYFLNSSYGRKQAKDGVFAGGGVPNLNVGVVKEFDVVVPPLPEQQKIASILSSIDTNIEEKQRKLQQTQSLKKSLMQDLLTGKVRVNVH